MHVSIARWLTDLIGRGDLVPGDRLPSEERLAALLGVSRMTLRQALSTLESHGELERKTGRTGGTFVREPRIDCDLTGLAGFTEQMRRAHLRAGARVVSAETVAANATVARALAVRRGDAVHEIVRVRTVRREPLALEHSYFPLEPFPDLLSQRLTGSLYGLLERAYGLGPTHAVEALEPVIARPHEAVLLRIDVSTPLMLIERTAFTSAGLPVEFARDLFRPDRIRIRSAPGSARRRPSSPVSRRPPDRGSGRGRTRQGATEQGGSELVDDRVRLALEPATGLRPHDADARHPGGPGGPDAEIESSNTSTDDGSAPSLAAAISKPSGCGLPRLTSSSVTITPNMPESTLRPSTRSTSTGCAPVTMAMGTALACSNTTRAAVAGSMGSAARRGSVRSRRSSSSSSTSVASAGPVRASAGLVTASAGLVTASAGWSLRRLGGSLRRLGRARRPRSRRSHGRSARRTAGSSPRRERPVETVAEHLRCRRGAGEARRSRGSR